MAWKKGELKLFFLIAFPKFCSCERDRSSGSEEKKVLGHSLRKQCDALQISNAKTFALSNN